MKTYLFTYPSGSKETNEYSNRCSSPQESVSGESLSTVLPLTHTDEDNGIQPPYTVTEVATLVVQAFGTAVVKHQI